MIIKWMLPYLRYGGIVLGVIFLVVTGIALVDYLFGTTILTALWQWIVRFFQACWKILLNIWKIFLKMLPGYLKRGTVRTLFKGFFKSLGLFLFGLFVAVAGQERKEALEAKVEEKKAAAKRSVLQILWSKQLPFAPYLPAAFFVGCAVGFIWLFVEVQAWAQARHYPTFLGIDLLSFMVGMLCSQVLFTLPLMGFEHFVTSVFKPLVLRYENMARYVSRRARGVPVGAHPKGTEWIWGILHWLLLARPLVRHVMYRNLRDQRKQRDELGEKGLVDVWIERRLERRRLRKRAREKRRLESINRRSAVPPWLWNIAWDLLALSLGGVVFLGFMVMVLDGAMFVWSVIALSTSCVLFCVVLWWLFRWRPVVKEDRLTEDKIFNGISDIA